jgi:adenylate kinase family enzyme
MQIELIGCTSAGKSTLAGGILRACREQGLDIFLGEDFVLEQFRLNWIKNDPLRKLLVNLAALFASLVTWRNNRKFYLFATQLLFQLPIPQLERLNLLRNVLKKIGIHEIIRLRRTGQQVILVDEGVLHIAHNLFVHVSAEVKMEHLAMFAELVSLPDVVVYLKQPEELLINRIIKRGHKRIPDHSYNKVARFVKQAIVTFDKLVQHPAVENKLLVVGNDQNVQIAANDHGDPVMSLALQIIQSAFTDNTSCRPAEIIYAE